MSLSFLVFTADVKPSVRNRGSFEPDADLPNSGFTQFETDVASSLTAFKSAGVENMLIDLHNNGGGFVCLGIFLHQFFAGTSFGGGYAGFESTERGNELAAKIVAANVALGINDTFYSPVNWAFLNNTQRPISDDYDVPLLPATVNGQSEPTSQRLQDVCGTFDIPMPATPPFPLDKIAIIGNGNCASTCSMFSTLMVERHGVRTAVFGGPKEVGGKQAPVEYKGMAGNQVLEWADLDSEVKTAQLKNVRSVLPSFSRRVDANVW